MYEYIPESCLQVQFFWQKLQEESRFPGQLNQTSKQVRRYFLLRKIRSAFYLAVPDLILHYWSAYDQSIIPIA